MSVLASLKFFEFKDFTPAEKNAFLVKLEEGGYLHAIKARIISDARIKIQEALEARKRVVSLKERVKQLEAENAELRRRIRLTPAERKARVLELNEEDWTAPDIAKRMTAEGEAITPVAIRQIISRQRRKK
jgi:hypothetical protein